MGLSRLSNQGKQFPPEPLSAAEVRSLLLACAEHTDTGKRNRAMLAVMWRTGLRCAEVLALRASDIDPERGTVRVLRGKGRKARTVGADPDVMAVVAVWAAARAARGVGQGPLFCTLRGGPLCPRYVRALVKRLGEQAGIEHRVHPHGLRHTMAAELSDEGWPLLLISRQLGHSNVATTDTYLQSLHPAQVIDRARTRRWDLAG